MKINTDDIVLLKKLSHCKTCKNDTFNVISTGTNFEFKCTCCYSIKVISASKLKICVKEVISTIPRPTRFDM